MTDDFDTDFGVDSPEGYPQTAPYEWWIWHDEPHPTDPDPSGSATR